MSDERQNENMSADGAVSPGGVSLEQRSALLEAELAETKDRLLRALAETENVRRRAERERADASKYGAGAFAKDLLNVADNLRRALDSVPAGEGGEPMRGLLEGVAATERELLAAFERHSIRRVDPLGERFDHNLHQAMFDSRSRAGKRLAPSCRCCSPATSCMTACCVRRSSASPRRRSRQGRRRGWMRLCRSCQSSVVGIQSLGRLTDN
jgi:molecular chaperone GrpE (heat shock protein)